MPDSTAPARDATPSTPPHAAHTTEHALATAVVGLQWGDEGKGKIIDLLASEHDVVVRYNGGANAGHSIVVAGERYAVHLVPSGVFRTGVESVIGNGVVVDPMQLLKELDGLRERGIDVHAPQHASDTTATLMISDRAHVVAPYHKTQDALTEAWLSGSGGEAIGTTGRGIGPAYADKAGRSTAIRMGDLVHPERLRERLERICGYKSALLRTLAGDAELSGEQRRSVDAGAVYEALSAAGERLAPMIGDSVQHLHRRLRERKRLLFEGANATLLDVDHGTFPYVTSSSCAVSGIHSGTGVPGAAVGSVVGVMKAYGTRVGSGPFPTELHDATGDRIRTAGNEFGTTTGRPRRCGWLDLVAARYAVMVNGVTSLAIMLLDVLAGFDEVKVCTAYRLPDGSTTDRFTPDAEELSRIEPVYTTLEGFSGELTTATSLDDLPTAARRYVSFIEEFVGAPASVVSVGPGREQTIRLG